MESADLKPIGTSNDTDYDLYIKKLGCKLVIDQTKHTTAKPPLDMTDDHHSTPQGYDYEPPSGDGLRKPGYAPIFNGPSNEAPFRVQSDLISIRPNPTFLNGEGSTSQQEPYQYPKPIDRYDDDRYGNGPYRPPVSSSQNEDRPFGRPQQPPSYPNQIDTVEPQEGPYNYPKPIHSGDLGPQKPNSVDRFDYNNRYSNSPAPYADEPRPYYSGNGYSGESLRPLDTNYLPPVVNKTGASPNRLPSYTGSSKRPSDGFSTNSIEGRPGASYFYGKPMITHMKGSHGESITSIITEIKPGEHKNT